MRIENPFTERDLYDYLSEKRAGFQAEIAQLSDAQVSSNSHEYLVAYFLEKYRLEPLRIEPEDPTLREQSHCKITKRLQDPFDRYYSGSKTITVDGVCVRFYYPVIGDCELFHCKASTFSLGGYPPIDLKNQHLVLTREYQVYSNSELPSAEEVVSQFDGMLKSVLAGVKYANGDVKAYNASLESEISKCIEKREELARKFNVLFADLDISLEKKSGADARIPLKRKELVLTSSNAPAEKNCYIGETTFIEILELIRNCYATCERTPKTYKDLDEEALRDLALVPLNTLYIGKAVGEAFRSKGKTDICIEEQNRAAFVAECKIWKGSRAFSEAIDQLLGYLTWRDSKTALIVFSRNVNFNNVLNSTTSTLKSDERCLKFKVISPNEFDCKFVTAGKPGDITRIRVMVFDLHVEE